MKKQKESQKSDAIELSEDNISTAQLVFSIIHRIHYGHWYDYSNMVTNIRNSCNVDMTMALLEEILLSHMEEFGYVFEIKRFGTMLMCIKFEKLGIF